MSTTIEQIFFFSKLYKSFGIGYFPKKSPFKYRRCYKVSQLSSKWIRVVPLSFKHQNQNFLKPTKFKSSIC